MASTRFLSSFRTPLAKVAVVASVSLATVACTAGEEISSGSLTAYSSSLSSSDSAPARPPSAGGDLAQHGGARRLDGDQTAALQKAIETTGAKNVILLIGDGMGDSEITLARNYAEGAGGSFAGIDALPVTGQYTHYALDKEGRPDYVTDSAASGTAWATGTKTVPSYRSRAHS